jgi:hypothetical protein
MKEGIWGTGGRGIFIGETLGRREPLHGRAKNISIKLSQGPEIHVAPTDRRAGTASHSFRQISFEYIDFYASQMQHGTRYLDVNSRRNESGST